MSIGYKVCAEMNYPSGLRILEWNYYLVNDESLIPSDWATMSDDDKATYLNEDTNCHWVKGWIEGDDLEVADDEAGLQDYNVVELGEW
jgi:hypothetical protein